MPNPYSAPNVPEKAKAGDMIMQPASEPGLIMALGIICVQWSYLEMFMSLCYALMVFGKEINEEQNREAFLAVVDAFENLSTWQAKRKLMVAATRRRLDEETADKLDTLLKNIEKRHRRRNNVVHARWFYSGEKDTWTRRRGIISQGDEVEDFDFKRLLAIRDAILADTVALATFFEDLKSILKGTVVDPYLQAILRTEKTPRDTLKGALGGT